MYHVTLRLRVIKKKKKGGEGRTDSVSTADVTLPVTEPRSAMSIVELPAVWASFRDLGVWAI